MSEPLITGEKNNPDNSENVRDIISTDLPTLRHLDQTPIHRAENKRLCSQLSPIEEVSHQNVPQQIHTAIQEAMNAFVPKIIQQLESTLQETIKMTLNASLDQIKNDVQNAMMKEFNKFQSNTELKIWSEVEKLENYNRRDNLRIFDLQEDSSNYNGRHNGETSEATMQKVLTLANRIEANVSLNDISIAHRLPTKKDGCQRPVIVRFSRRIDQVNILRKRNA